MSKSASKPARVEVGHWIARIALALPLFLLILAVGRATGFKNFYTLDDAYIHLAHAELLSQGHYGVNPGEFAAASSSVLWPFILAPFQWIDQLLIAPLILNVAFCALAVWRIYGLFAGFCGLSRLLALVLAGALAYSVNAYGVVFTGMEHSLQFLLAVLVASGVVTGYFGRGFWVAVTLLPFVRYEGLFITGPVLAYLLLALPSERKRVLLSVIITAGGLLMFSAGLQVAGLSFLPSSILAKYGKSIHAVMGNLLAWPTWITISFAIFAGQLSRRRTFEVMLTLYLPLCAHVIGGRTGWFGRYEIAMIVYALVISISYLFEALRRAALSEPRFRNRGRLLPALVFMLLLGFRGLSDCTLQTPLAARNIADQQVQMGLFVRDYLRQSVAVNDLGAVSYFSKNYVLDLFGLGSYEVLKLRRSRKPADQWIADLMARKRVRFAIVYDSWFPERPSEWTRVAKLRLPTARITPAESEVSFYALDSLSQKRMKDALGRYLRDHPQYKDFVVFEA